MYRGGFPIYDIALLFKLNHKALLSVDTPVGETDNFFVYNVVKQGTIWGPPICCCEVDEVNKGEEVVAFPTVQNLF